MSGSLLHPDLRCYNLTHAQASKRLMGIAEVRSTHATNLTHQS
jgi:hypothetical protein